MYSAKLASPTFVSPTISSVSVHLEKRIMASLPFFFFLLTQASTSNSQTGARLMTGFFPAAACALLYTALPHMVK